MELLEEMLRCRDVYEKYGSHDFIKIQLNDKIDKIITEVIQNRK